MSTTEQLDEYKGLMQQPFGFNPNLPKFKYVNMPGNAPPPTNTTVFFMIHDGSTGRNWAYSAGYWDGRWVNLETREPVAKRFYVIGWYVEPPYRSEPWDDREAKR